MIIQVQKIINPDAPPTLILLPFYDCRFRFFAYEFILYLPWGLSDIKNISRGDRIIKIN